MSRKVYIGRLNDQVRDRDVDKFFRGFHVRDIILKNGYGFVEFEDPRDADDAVYEMNGRELLGDRIIVELARGPSRRGGYGGGYGRGGGGGSSGGFRRDGGSHRDSGSQFKPVWLDKYGAPVRTPYRVVVENLSSRVSWQDLKDYLRQGGEVTYADAHKEKRNQGTVDFATYGDMKNAVNKLNNTEINGRRIRLVEQKVESYREESHSRSRSRSRSPQRAQRRSVSRSRSLSPRGRYAGNRERQSRSGSASRSPECGSRSPREDNYSENNGQFSGSPRSESPDH